MNGLHRFAFSDHEQMARPEKMSRKPLENSLNHFAKYINQQDAVNAVKALLPSLPPQNYVVLKYLMEFLVKMGMGHWADARKALESMFP